MILVYWLFILAILITGAIAALSAAPWVPIRKKEVDRMLALAELKPGMLIYDLGSGDGRVLIQAVKKYGVKAEGFEISLLPYLYSIIKVLILGLRNNIKIHYKSIWSISLEPADVVFCFLMPNALKKLENKVAKELKPAGRFVSYAFRLHSKNPTLVSRPDSKCMPIYRYG